MRASVLALGVAAAVGLIGPARAASQSGKPSYCVNDQATFYPYVEGQNCRSGYQLADGNCRLPSGEVIAVAKAECSRQAGEVVLPAPAARLTGEQDPKVPPAAKPLTVQNPKNE